MPSTERNQEHWIAHDWSHGGDDWSKGWGSTAMLWHGTILPRVHFFFPAAHLLEIAPGYGRVTAFLLAHCARYTGLDLTPRCVEACRARFSSSPHARFEHNDGRSLDALADDSVDAVVSWDSLVHADPESLEAYVHALRKKLVPGGRAFLHHSNLGAFQGADPDGTPLENPHWRDERMSAALLCRFAREAGMSLDAQELVQWGAPIANDCFSWLTRPLPGERPTVNETPGTHPSFGAEIAHQGWLFRFAARGR